MPSYSLVSLVNGVKQRIEFAGANAYGILSNSEAVNCLKQETGAVCKILFREWNNTD